MPAGGRAGVRGSQRHLSHGFWEAREGSERGGPIASRHPGGPLSAAGGAGGAGRGRCARSGGDGAGGVARAGARAGAFAGGPLPLRASLGGGGGAAAGDGVGGALPATAGTRGGALHRGPGSDEPGGVGQGGLRPPRRQAASSQGCRNRRGRRGKDGRLGSAPGRPAPESRKGPRAGWSWPTILNATS